jgi:hypothetical protein
MRILPSGKIAKPNAAMSAERQLSEMESQLSIY